MLTSVGFSGRPGLDEGGPAVGRRKKGQRLEERTLDPRSLLQKIRGEGASGIGGSDRRSLPPRRPDAETQRCTVQLKLGFKCRTRSTPFFRSERRRRPKADRRRGPGREGARAQAPAGVQGPGRGPPNGTARRSQGKKSETLGGPDPKKCVSLAQAHALEKLEASEAAYAGLMDHQLQLEKKVFDLEKQVNPKDSTASFFRDS